VNCHRRLKFDKEQKIKRSIGSQFYSVLSCQIWQ
jgi:hypothetical protein